MAAFLLGEVHEVADEDTGSGKFVVPFLQLPVLRHTIESGGSINGPEFHPFEAAASVLVNNAHGASRGFAADNGPV